MAYAIRADGGMRAVTPAMPLESGEELYDVLPEWVQRLIDEALSIKETTKE